MAEIPDQIVLRRDRDLEGRAGGIYFRRAIISFIKKGE
jgi:hypothetical protein